MKTGKKPKKPINVEVGLRVKWFREAAGLTQEEFAELTDLGDKHVSAIECGSVGLSLSSLKRICSVLSISADALLFDPAADLNHMNHEQEIQLLASRLSRLPPNKFIVTKSILDRVFVALAFHPDDIENIPDS